MTIVAEIGIGYLTVIGLFTRLAALAGLFLNFGLFLSASWNIYPYFLGSDVVFCVGWLTLAIAGPGGLCLDIVVPASIDPRLGQNWRALVLGPAPTLREEQPGEADTAAMVRQREQSRFRLSRAEALGGGIGALGLVLLGLVPRSKFTAAASNAAPNTAAGSQPSASGTSATPSSRQSVGSLSQLPVNSAIATTDPKSGDPAVVVHTSGSTVRAYDAVCTHAGCTVQYDPSYKLLVCPCHGGAFDPAQGGQVVAGPPPSPLTELPVKVDSAGNIYLT
jgi:thiosulfate dehydrogenase [quinone] large subunit